MSRQRGRHWGWRKTRTSFQTADGSGHEVHKGHEDHKEERFVFVISVSFVFFVVAAVGPSQSISVCRPPETITSPSFVVPADSRLTLFLRRSWNTSLPA
jgi:hypothetical protein